MYDWVYAKVVTTYSTLTTEAALRDADIMVGDPLEWLALVVSGEKMICNSFDDCMVPFHECLFTIVGLRLPFYELDVIVQKYLNVALTSFSWGHRHT